MWTVQISFAGTLQAPFDCIIEWKNINKMLALLERSKDVLQIKLFSGSMQILVESLDYNGLGWCTKLCDKWEWEK